MSSKKSFWPYGILLSIFAIIIACIATIVFASNYPVYEDSYYFSKYQDVKYNYADIEAKQKAFEREFKLSLKLEPSLDKKRRVFYELSQPIKPLGINIKSPNQASLKELKIQALLTRPHTNEQDEELKINSLENGDFLISLPNLEKGRWQIALKLENSSDQIAFYSYNLLVK